MKRTRTALPLFGASISLLLLQAKFFHYIRLGLIFYSLFLSKLTDWLLATANKDTHG